MKKIYLLAFALCAGSGLFAQSLQGFGGKYQLTRENVSPMTSARVEAGANHVGMRNVILSEDFQGVAGTLPADIPATWSTSEVVKSNGTTADATDDFNGPAFMIHNATTANAGGYWPVAEVGAGGNKFAGANDDAPPCDCTMSSIYLETPSIDFSAATYPAVTFDIYHDANFGGGDAFVSVSADGGTTWTQINYPADANGVLPIEEGNWQTIVLTLFDYSGFADVRIRFNWSDGDTWASGFGVDNVVVGDLEDYSLTMDKVVFGDWNQADFGLGFWDYTMIPLSQASPVHATTVVSNTGFFDLTGVDVTVTVMNGATSEGTWNYASPDPIVSLTKDTLSVVTDFIPSAVGNYMIMAGSTTTAGTETDLTDNGAIANFEMTDCTYARDLDGAQAFMTLAGGDYAGNLFDMYADETFGSIQVAIGAGTTAGAALAGFIFLFEGFDAAGAPIFTLVDGSETQEVTAFDEHMNSVNGNDFTCLPFVNPVTLTGGNVYLVVVSCSDEMRMPVSGSNVWVTSWINSAGTFGATSGVPMVRLIGQCADSCTVSVKEEVKGDATLEQNIPNPASDVTTINYVLNGSSKVTLSVRDIAGQLVETFELGNKSIGKHNYQLNVSGYAPGMYTYTINAGNTNITRKMMVK